MEPIYCVGFFQRLTRTGISLMCGRGPLKFMHAHRSARLRPLEPVLRRSIMTDPGTYALTTRTLSLFRGANGSPVPYGTTLRSRRAADQRNFVLD